MEQQLSDPQLLTPDFSKPEVRITAFLIAKEHIQTPVLIHVSFNQVPLQLHAIMLALDAFLEQHGRLPNIG